MTPSCLEELERLCRARRLPVTVQRRTVLEVLSGRRDHPTADQIFEDVRARIPGVARGTVYRILETFGRIGIVRKVCHPGAAVRFETKTHRHHHLVCLRCGKMVDLEDRSLDRIPLPDARGQGFQITEYSVQFRGTCSDCLREAGRARPRRGRRSEEIPKRRRR